MNVHTRRSSITGPAGAIECAIDEPGQDTVRGVAVLCHPHPQHGGALQNKVVQTLARAFVQLGWRAVRFNFRGVGGSQGTWDEGRGEVDDALAVIAAHRDPALPLALGGFSFGGFVATQAQVRLPDDAKAQRLVLIAPAARNFALAAVPQDTIVIHGEADDVVPLSAVLDWARPQVLPIVVVPATGHFFHGQLPLLRQLVVGAWH
ncbi:MAG: alpha/beta hydrolase [Rubrivivax sp. SCN 71-131]|nr:MAG: alpha/beta hydrolase [Rubrivivax sp. SCN 71-131]